jgi:hypothetical protein
LPECRDTVGIMITKKTAYEIWIAFDEIDTSRALIEKLTASLKEGEPFNLRDTFGRPRGLELGVPTSNAGHRLFDVAPALAKAIIEAHVAGKEAELRALAEKARAELST